MFYIYPYKTGSKSAKTLSSVLNGKLIRLVNSKFKGSGDKIVINWGNSTPNEELESCMTLNTPEKVAIASNKLSFFNLVKDLVNIPPFTTSIEEASKWIEEGKSIMSRELLTGNSGAGIVFIENNIGWDSYNKNNGKMFVEYIPKKGEYRVHIVGGEVVLCQRKALPKSIDPKYANFKVRNKDNGFIFVKNEGKNPPEDVITQAKKAMEVVDLDFGAVDVIYNDYRQKAYVLEINTAPGLEGTTVDTYIEALKQYTQLFLDIDKEKLISSDPKVPNMGKKQNKKFQFQNLIIDDVPQGVEMEPEDVIAEILAE